MKKRMKRKEEKKNRNQRTTKKNNNKRFEGRRYVYTMLNIKKEEQELSDLFFRTVGMKIP